MLRAENLPVNHLTGTAYSAVKLALLPGGARVATATQAATTEPEFNQEFSFTVR